jgi:thiosulfate/3-mercaptopyruvate sulfurtransferase
MAAKTIVILAGGKKGRPGSLAARFCGLLCAAMLVALFGICIAALLARKAVAAQNKPSGSASPAASESWTDAQTVKPADLVKEIADTKGANKPVIVCSGFQVLYEGAHVPGAVFHGPASTPQGLDDLKKWAQGISRSSKVVVYCGCCPFEHCPNIRPAFKTLHSIGFQHLRVLVLPNNFAKDWVGQGYAYDKGK